MARFPKASRTSRSPSPSGSAPAYRRLAGSGGRWIGPVVRVSGRPVPWWAWAMISAVMETAVSSGVRGSEIEADGGTQPGQPVRRDALLAQPAHALVVGAPGAHGPDVGDGQVECQAKQRDVELGVVGEDADGGSLVHLGVVPGSGGASRPTTSSACGKRAGVAKTGRASQTVTW